MTAAFFATIVLGAVIGLRLKALVLVPATVVAILAASALGIAQGQSVLSIALTMLLAAVALQTGYLSGGAISVAVAGARLSRHRKRWPHDSGDAAPVR